MGHTSTHIVNQASSLIEREGGFIPFVRNVGFGGVALAIWLEIIDGIRGFGSVIFGIPTAIGRGFILLTEVFFRTSGDVLGAGAERTMRSFATGIGSFLGPLGQPASVGIVMLSLFIFFFALNRIRIGPLSAIRGGSN